MAVDISDFKKVLNIILNHVEEDLGIRQVEIDSSEDFYWDVTDDSLNEVSGGKPSCDIGRLSDDWEFLQPILNNPEQGVALTLIHAAPLLRYLAKKIGQ